MSLSTTNACVGCCAPSVGWSTASILGNNDSPPKPPAAPPSVGTLTLVSPPPPPPPPTFFNTALAFAIPANTDATPVAIAPKLRGNGNPAPAAIAPETPFAVSIKIPASAAAFAVLVPSPASCPILLNMLFDASTLSALSAAILACCIARASAASFSYIAFNSSAFFLANSNSF